MFSLRIDVGDRDSLFDWRTMAPQSKDAKLKRSLLGIENVARIVGTGIGFSMTVGAGVVVDSFMTFFSGTNVLSGGATLTVEEGRGGFVGRRRRKTLSS